jgi:small subunit ribosomal protein S2
VRKLAADAAAPSSFVGTKRQAREIVARGSRRAPACPIVDQRWLGGMLTNFKTVKASHQAAQGHGGRQQEAGTERMSKKEALLFGRELEKLEQDTRRHQGHERRCPTHCS